MSDSDRSDRTQDIGQGLAVFSSVVLCCTIVAAVAFAAASYSTDRDERAEYYQSEAQRNADAICVGREGGLLAECIEEQRRASRDAYAAEQDLNAQRKMALWALWMFVVSAVTALLTLWALWYVRGTLKATREALDDTGEATKAMVEANRIAANAQRPWVGIDAEPVALETRGAAFYVEVLVKFRNFGKLPATKLNLNMKLIWTDGEYTDIVQEWWDKFEPKDENHRGLILPNDTLRFPQWAFTSRMTVPYRQSSDRSYAAPILIVSAIYKSAVTGEEWLRTDRAFSIGRRGGGFRLDCTYDEGVEYALNADDLIIEQITSTNLGH